MKTYQDKSSPLYDGLPFMEIEGVHIPFPCIAEVKLDGEFQYVVKKQGKTYLVNKKEHGRIRTDMPVTNSIDIPDDSVLLAELVYGGGTNFYEFLSHKLDPDLNLAVFGCLRYDGQEIWKTNDYLATRKLLESQTFYDKKVSLIPKAICRNQQELDSFYNLVVGKGYEGIVIKDPLSKYIDGQTGRWAKRKFVADNDFVIIGYQSGTKRAKNLSILVGHQVDGIIKRLTYVGGGFKLHEKDALLGALKTITTGHSGDEYYVQPKIVVTVKHYGVIRNADGTVNSLRHPQFKCIRFDKVVHQVDTIK
jgi:ATP-dependent DNA ligase